MENIKDAAKAVWLEQRKEEAKKSFQSQVNAALNEICTLSHQLGLAKERFSKLNYEEPESIDV